MKVVSIIRNRGQLTIPDSIRQKIPWVQPMSAVTITVVGSQKLEVTPSQIQVNWEELWERIKRVSAYRGTGRGNLSAFIAEDRKTRR